jgi:collagen type VII alpha
MAFPVSAASGTLYTNALGTVYQYIETDNKWVKYTVALGVTGGQGVTGLAGETGIQGLANFKYGDLPELPSPNQPELFWDVSDDILYYWETGAQAWIDIQTGCKGITGPNGFTGVQGDTGVQGETGIQGVTGVILTDMNVGMTFGLTGAGKRYLGLQPIMYQGITLTKASKLLFTYSARVEHPVGGASIGLEITSRIEAYTGQQYEYDTPEAGAALISFTPMHDTWVTPELPAGTYTGVVNGLRQDGGQTGILNYGNIALIALDGGAGPQGVTGPGFTGVMGPTGPAGAPQGVTGIQGFTGLQGPTGLMGPTGIRGMTGAQGKGETGLGGITGLQGLTGAEYPELVSFLYTGVSGQTGLFSIPMLANKTYVLHGHATLNGSLPIGFTGPTGSVHADFSELDFSVNGVVGDSESGYGVLIPLSGGYPRTAIFHGSVENGSNAGNLVVYGDGVGSCAVGSWVKLTRIN